ncbi:MAG: tRNA (N6-threonylcarbamoyladenosine(37)-N6)-methyltransferase TrmO [Chloroflexota bacterium]|nr:tRNA (N6-threonylcarbamoyladenosine(37)-N6)-methyltransferase TrmO [Chloroflexota bacterium]
MSQAERQMPIELHPIARVKNNVLEKGKLHWQNVESELVFDPSFVDALDGIDEFSHIIVIFHMNRSPDWENSMSMTHPQMRPELPLVGVFATRSPVRPNPLGMTIVKLLERKGNVLRVVGLDALDDTPVLDIKGYFTSDSAADARVPEWVHKLHQQNQ